MPNFIERFQAGWKAFRTGQAVVPHHSGYQGALPAAGESSPTAYGEYIARSVGVYACATLRAENLSGLPLKLYRGIGEGRELVEYGALVDLLRKVNPFWTFSQLVEMTELSLGLWGKAFWVLERGPNGKGVPTEIWWARPDQMRVVPHPEKYIAGYVLTANGQEIPFLPEEVVYIRYPNPLDEFGGLSPIAAARLSIELGHAGLMSNKRLFDQGLQAGGIISPADKDQTWTKDQTEGLERLLSARLKGEHNAHKWAVLSQQVSAQQLGVNPKDAEFLGQMRWSLADVCRVYKVSPVLIQDLEHSTYSNFEQALKALWVLALTPESKRIAAAITEQLLPLFPGEADEAEFDLSGVESLQEGEDAKWMREQGQLQTNAITINEWRQSRGLEPVPWGDRPAGQADQTTPGEPAKAVKAAKLVSGEIPFGSDAHKVVWKRFARMASRHEARFQALAVELFKEQEKAFVESLEVPEKSVGTKAIEDFFDRAYWIREFLERALPRLLEAAQDAGDGVYDELSIDGAFDVHNPLVTEFLEARAQRFAEEVNDTTWRHLKTSLAEGEQAGESIAKLAARVASVMADRIRSDATTIARTEVMGALNGGALLAAEQSGEVDGKSWLATFDGHDRATHMEAHVRYQANPISLGEMFEVGGARGPAPGQMGSAKEDINCRCTMTWVLRDGKSIKSGVLEGIQRWLRGGNS